MSNLILLNLVDRRTLYRARLCRLSPVDTLSLFDMADLSPSGVMYILTQTTYTHFAFRYEQNIDTPICYISKLKCLMTLLPCCLRLAHTVASTHPKLATSGLLNPFQMGFPPVRHCTLFWTHAHLKFYHILNCLILLVFLFL